VSTLKDFGLYLWRLVRNWFFLAGAIIDALGLIAKSVTPPTRRPGVLDESWFYLTVLAVAFVIAAYRLDRDLRANLFTERDKLQRELRDRLIELKFSIESRPQEPIPINQAMVIEATAKDLGDAYVIAECAEIRTILQRSRESGLRIMEMFVADRRDFDSVRARVDYVLKHLDKIAESRRRV